METQMAKEHKENNLVGGIRTRWLFADMLQDGKKYIGELCGVGAHKGKPTQTNLSGAIVPYVVWTGALDDGIVTEYQICSWRIESKQKFDPTKVTVATISRRQNNIWLEV